ncbi:ricin B lectin domain-containing protein [Schizophyllum fasciatum]
MRPTALFSTLLALPTLALAASITSGQSYKITNSKAGTVVDLSAGDNSSVIGWPYHGGSNQHWTLDWAGEGWNFRSLATGEYIGLAGDATDEGADSIADGTRLEATADAFTWHIWTDPEVEGAYRIFAPNTNQVFDLYGHGDATPGTPITTWYTWDAAHQAWAFDEGEWMYDGVCLITARL